MLPKHHRRKHEDVGILILPATGAHSGLHAGLLKKCLPIPILFHWNLRKQQPLGCAVLHDQTVLAHLDLLDIDDAPQRREH